MIGQSIPCALILTITSDDALTIHCSPFSGVCPPSVTIPCIVYHDPWWWCVESEIRSPWVVDGFTVLWCRHCDRPHAGAVRIEVAQVLEYAALMRINHPQKSQSKLCSVRCIFDEPCWCSRLECICLLLIISTVDINFSSNTSSIQACHEYTRRLLVKKWGGFSEK